MKKLTILLILLFASFTLLTACQQSSTDSSQLVGTYVNPNDSSEYLDLRTDGTFLLIEFATEFPGTWSVEGNTITLDYDEFGSAFNATGTIDGNTIHDQEGKSWVKQEGG